VNNEIFENFKNFIIHQKSQKNETKKHTKKRLVFRVDFEGIWVYFEPFFHYFWAVFRGPKANQQKIGREAIHTVKTILLSRSDLPNKNKKSTQNHSKVNKKTPLNPKPAKSAFWVGFWLHFASQIEVVSMKKHVSEKGLWESFSP